MKIILQFGALWGAGQPRGDAKAEEEQNLRLKRKC